MIRTFILVNIALALTFSGVGLCGDFVATELKIPDPEFDQAGARVTWQVRNGTDHELWIAYVNRSTGAIENPIMIDTGLVPISLTKNGPEWAYNAIDAEVVYAVYNANNKATLKRAWESSPGAWQAEELPNANFPNIHRLGPLGSTDSRSAFPLKILYAAARGENIYFVWRELEDPFSEALLPDNLGFTHQRLGIGRWVRERESIITNAPDGWNIPQAVEYNVRTGDTTWLTSSLSSKGDSFMWESPNPDHEGRFIFFTTVEIQFFPWRGLNVYLENGQGEWDLINGIYPYYPPFSGDYAYISSPEPFEYGNHSYISFVVSDMPTAGDSTKSQIWVAGADPTVMEPTMVSNSNERIRKDPEAFIGEETAWIYYSIVENGFRQLRICETGL